LSGDVADLSNFKLTLDDTNASGSVKLASIENQAIEFDLQFDTIDLDRYLEPVPEAPAGSGSGGGGSKSTADEPLDLPVEDIRALDLIGRLGFGELRVTEALLTNVEMHISAKTGLVRLHPFTADVYGGKYSDDLRLNVRGNVPKVILNTDLKNFQIGEYLADTEDFENLTGAANLKLKANTSGNSEAEMTRNLRGNTSFDVKEARYIGTDLWHEIRVAKARIKGDKAPPTPAKPYTDISQFKGTAKINKGVVKNKDFLGMIPLIRLTGAGDINLVTNQMDYQLQAQVTGEKTFEDGYSMKDLEGLKIPVKVKGDLEQPSFSVDLGAVLGEIAKQQARKKLLDKFGIEESGKKDGKKGSKQKSKEPKEQLKEGLRDIFR
jgi:AsmA protein